MLLKAFQKTRFLLAIVVTFLAISTSQAASLELTLKLPNEEIADSDFSYQLSIKDNAPRTPAYRPFPLIIKRGDNSSSVSIPFDSFSGRTLSIKFTDVTTERNSEYLRTFYYSQIASGNATWSACSKTKITTDSNKSLVVGVPKGRTIRGRVSFPSGESVKARSTMFLFAEFEANGKNYKDEVTHIMSVGDNVIDYVLTVPDVQGGTTKVCYHGSVTNWKTDPPTWSYLGTGYYAGSETVYGKELATPLPHGNHANINLTLIRGARITGTFKLPSGTAPSDLPIHFFVEYYQDNIVHSSYGDSYMIEQGDNSVEYSISVDHRDFGKPLRLSYRLQDLYNVACLTEKYLHGGFVGNNGMTWDVQSAKKIIIHGDTKIDITALSGKRFTGEVTHGEAFKLGHSVKIALAPSNSEPSLLQHRACLASLQTNYCFIVPDTTDVSFYLGYWMDNVLQNPVGGVVSVGYYKDENETTNLYSELTPLIADRDRSGLDLEITNQVVQTIRGKVLLPNEEVALTDNGLKFIITATQDTPFNPLFSQLDTNKNQGVVEKNEQSVQFSIPVPPDPSVRWVVLAAHPTMCSLEKEETPYAFLTYFPNISGSNEEQTQTVSYLDDPITIEILKQVHALQQNNGGILKMMSAILAGKRR